MRRVEAVLENGDFSTRGRWWEPVWYTTFQA